MMVGRAEKTLITWSVPHPEASGRDLRELASEWGLSLEAAAEKLQPAGAIYFQMDEADVRRVLAFPSAMIGSDGLPHDAKPHPRLWGTFPRVLGHYVREVGLFPLEEAVRKMTTLPAAEFGLKRRGRLAEGYAADLVVFDPGTVIDRATFDAPMTPADGIELVLVAGTPVWRDGRATNARPGRALRRGDA
jgi:N-acyl-D-amino-acid deacylase